MNRNDVCQRVFFMGNGITCKPVSEASKVRDVQWMTCRCSLNFDTIGIWPDNSDGTEINGCDRSHDHKLLAVADDAGLVKLFTYPCSQPKVHTVYIYMDCTVTCWLPTLCVPL